MKRLDGNQKARLAVNDANAFNSVMMRYGIEAGILINSIESLRENCKVFPAAVCIYKITTFGATSFADVVRREMEVRSAIAASRKKTGLFEKSMSIRFDMEPFLSLEVDSPPGFVLDRQNITDKEFTASIGTMYSVEGETPVVYDLNKHHQTLVAAVSGHGKSRLLKNCLLGLLSGTSPEKLRVILVDFKNDDLAPYKKMPHVENYVWKPTEATKAIKALKRELDLRIEATDKPKHRILLVIDEGAEIDKGLDDTLSSIMKMGRSLHINVLFATQYPTAAQVGQKIARAFTHRFVGRTDGASSALWATGIAGSGAELLRKPGAFLYAFGGNIDRFQTFYVPDEKESEILESVKC